MPGHAAGHPARWRGGRSTNWANGWGGQPFRLFMQCLDQEELQPEFLVHEAIQDVHPGLPVSKTSNAGKRFTATRNGLRSA